MRDLVKRRDVGFVKGHVACSLPPHSVKIMRIEAEERLEPVLYEVEWAYLPQFNDLGKQRRPVGLTPHEGASGRMIVTNLGGSAENCAEWDCVYSRTGGAYRMTISYLPPETGRLEVNDRRLEVTVNGHPYPVSGSLVKDRAQGICTVSLDVALKPGENVVRIGSRYTWTPDIDCFSLERL